MENEKPQGNSDYVIVVNEVGEGPLEDIDKLMEYKRKPCPDG